MDDPTEAAIKRVAGASTCSQLLRYYPPKDGGRSRHSSSAQEPASAPAAFSYEDPADEVEEGGGGNGEDDAGTAAAVDSPTDDLGVSTAYELHTDCHDYVGGAEIVAFAPFFIF